MKRPIGRSLAACATAFLFTCSALVPANASTLAGVSRGNHLDEAQTRQIVAELRKHVKYVFVLYQENRSFDSYFGTFPGANGVFSQQPANTPGYFQPIQNTDGTMGVQTPFRIDPSWFGADTDDGDHSHAGIVAKMDVTNGAAQMDRYALREEADRTPSGNPSEQAKQYGELVMGHEDCNTIPIYWNYAKKFVLFDNIFQTETTPSTPGNIAIFAGQAGLTQLAEHPGEIGSGNGGSGPGVPVLSDANPFWGSSEDPTGTGKMPYNPGDGGTPQLNLTFASLPLTLAGKSISKVTQGDRSPSSDLADVQLDLHAIQKNGVSPLDWGWFQEGFDKEPTDPPSGPSSGTHNSYVTHHNGPQYFGYLSNNPTEQTHFHGVGDFFNTISTGGLATSGGVYYLKGGFQNIFGLTPTDPDPAVQANFVGDDDHPTYSDAQISEALVAEAVNTIAKSKYWSQSAIVISWDDSEGYYDHVRPPLRVNLPGLGLVSEGPRVPMIVISPFAKTGAVSHEMGDQVSAVKMVDTVFGLQPLATLPNERRARTLGFNEFGQLDMGPVDGLTEGVSDLISAFDPERLAGRRPLLSPGYASIPDRLITSLPAVTGYGCNTLGITPTDIAQGIQDTPPSDFNPRPGTDPPPNAPVEKVNTNRMDD